MKKLRPFLVVIGGLVVIGIITNSGGSSEAADSPSEQAAPAEPGQYAELAQCLTDNEFVMYGTDRCSHCQNQKKMFGSDFQYVTFIDCDDEKMKCTQAGVTGYPTRVDKAGQAYPGTRQLEQLAQYAGCEI